MVDANTFRFRISVEEKYFVRNVFSIFSILTSALLLNVSDAADVAHPTQEKVSHIYVMRRPLNGQPLTSIGTFAHSALLLQTDQGNSYALEYQRDGKAHLTLGKQKAIRENRQKGIAHIRMVGWANGEVSDYYWERQLVGEPIFEHWSPQELQQKMQDSMQGYSLLKREHCHTAQLRLRSALGLVPPARRMALGVKANEP